MMKMQSVFGNTADCCGCGLCAELCPRGAITMSTDREGFFYPNINQEICVDCGICQKVCPVINSGKCKNSAEGRFFAASHKSENVLMNSTSGGAFTAISDVILDSGGLVCGADFDFNFRADHRSTGDKKGRDRMRVSKYVQSDITGLYKEIKYSVKYKTILFSGTPCQCAALRSYFGVEEPENLFLCDVICHSVPSPLVWKSYKKILEKEKGAKLTSVCFRSKKYTWNRENSNRGFLYTVENADEVYEDDRYYDLFIHKRVISRPSCEKCRFCDTHRASDMTIADCWGVEKHEPKLYNPKGVSLIITNTPKGEKMLEAISHSMNISQRPKEEITAEQQRLLYPVEYPKERALFWNHDNIDISALFVSK